MSARVDAAARVIARAYGRDFDTDKIAKRAVQAADRAAAKEAKAARAITTAEELDALRDGAAVLDSDHDVSTKHDGKWHGYEMNPLDSRKFENYGPFTVLWEPEVSGE